MIKFFKMKDSEIRRAIEVDEDGNKIKVVALIGQVEELLSKEIIFKPGCDLNGHLDKWLVVPADSEVVDIEYNSLAEAKASIRG